MSSLAPTSSATVNPELERDYASAERFDTFICPVSAEVMKDPWAIPCGHTFEKFVLDRIAASSTPTCPTCRYQFQKYEMVKNFALAEAIPRIGREFRKVEASIGELQRQIVANEEKNRVAIQDLMKQSEEKRAADREDFKASLRDILTEVKSSHDREIQVLMQERAEFLEGRGMVAVSTVAATIENIRRENQAECQRIRDEARKESEARDALDRLRDARDVERDVQIASIREDVKTQIKQLRKREVKNAQCAAGFGVGTAAIVEGGMVVVGVILMAPFGVAILPPMAIAGAAIGVPMGVKKAWDFYEEGKVKIDDDRKKLGL